MGVIWIPFALANLVVITIGDVFSPQNILESARCSGTHQCSFHNLSCHSPEDHIVFHGASYAFGNLDDNLSSYYCKTGDICQKQDLCCKRSARDFCHLAFQFTNLLDLTFECTGKSSCVFKSPENSRIYASCSDHYLRDSSSTFLRYTCVSGASIFDTRSNVTATAVTSASLLLNGSVFDSQFPHSAVCHLDSRSSSPTSVQLYMFAVLFRSGTDWTVKIQSRNSFYILNPSWFRRGSVDHMLAKSVQLLQTPIVVNITIDSRNYPDIFWIWFEGVSNRFDVKCTTSSKCTDCASTTDAPTSSTTTTTTTTTTTSTQTPTTTPTVNPTTSVPLEHPPSTPVHVNTSPETTPDGGDASSNGTSALGDSSPQDTEGNRMTGIIVGSVVTVFAVLAVAVAVVLLLCRRQNLKRHAEETRRRSVLPSRSTLGDDGYCVPVISASGVSWAMDNQAYVSDTSACNSGEKVPFGVSPYGQQQRNTAVAQVGKLQRPENGHKENDSGKGLNNCNEILGEDGEIYANLNDSWNEDVESGIDDDSFESEFDDYDIQPSSNPNATNALTTNGQVDGNAAPSGLNKNAAKRYAAGEQIYFELEPEYHNLPDTIHVMDEMDSSDDANLQAAASSMQLFTPDSSMSSQPASGTVSSVPSNPLPPEPRGINFMGRVRHGANNVKRKIRALVPKRERFSPAKQGRIKMSDLSANLPPSTESSTSARFTTRGSVANGSSTAKLSITSEYAQRNLPTLPLPEPRGITGITTQDWAANEAVYMMAKPVELCEDTRETTLSFNPFATGTVNSNGGCMRNGVNPLISKSGDGAGIKTMAAQAGQPKQDYENRMPRDLIAELKLRSNTRSPTPDGASPTRDPAGPGRGKDIIDTPYSLKVTQKTKDGYAEVMKKKHRQDDAKLSNSACYPETSPDGAHLTTADSIQTTAPGRSETHERTEIQHFTPYNRATSGRSAEDIRDPTYDHVPLPDDVFPEDMNHVYFNLEDATPEQEDC